MGSMMRFLRFLALAMALTGSGTFAARAATDWSVERTPDTITWEGTDGAGKLFTGRCVDFDAKVAFDPADLAHSSVTVTIDMGACLTGEADKDGYLPQQSWFDVGGFPKAVFEATRFRHDGGDRYVAEGTLTLKGVTRPVTLPFALDIDGAKAHATGETTLQRLAFGVGDGKEFSSSDVAGTDVKVKIDLHATKAGT
jgi:polyisoprenoid-binding protein YceI